LCCATHAAGPSAGLAGICALNGQPGRVIEKPCQRRACATTSSAARQCAAWLSPTSAIVARLSLSATPNAHGLNAAPGCASGVHGEVGQIAAFAGRG
jgi:hypothetical protein